MNKQALFYWLQQQLPQLNAEVDQVEAELEEHLQELESDDTPAEVIMQVLGLALYHRMIGKPEQRHLKLTCKPGNGVRIQGHEVRVELDGAPLPGCMAAYWWVEARQDYAQAVLLMRDVKIEVDGLTDVELQKVNSVGRTP